MLGLKPSPHEGAQDVPEFGSVGTGVVTANTQFAFNLFNEIRKTEQDTNIFISPLSVSIALAMTLNGAANETEQAMIKTLQLQGLDSESMNVGYAQLRQTLQALDSEGDLIIANSLWAHEGVNITQDFLQRNTQFFGAEISTLDFNAPSTLQTINQWINTKTKGKIPRILEDINPEALLLLINTIYFKAVWLAQFNPRLTWKGNFHLINGDKKRVSMMSRSRYTSYLYYKGDTFQAISLPYYGRSISMYIFLPDPESDLNTFLANVNAERWEDWMSRFHRQSVAINIPKFKLEYSIQLSNPLKTLGMGITFSDKADFSRIASPLPMGLFIDKVVQKTVIDVHEGGTEAAAATAVGPLPGAARVEFVRFIADRPFFFAIRDNDTKTVLFMGIVMEP